MTTTITNPCDVHRLVGRRVKILALRDSLGMKVRDLRGLTGEIGVVIRANEDRALVRLKSGPVTFDLDRIHVLRDGK